MSLDEAAKITGLKPEDIFKAAEWIAKPKEGGKRRRTMFAYEKGLIWGNDNYRTNAALVNIALATGNVGHCGARMKPPLGLRLLIGAVFGVIGVQEGPIDNKSGGSAFLRHLVDRGLSGVQLIISDACRGLVESAAEFLPGAQWQRCVVHFYRNVFSLVPSGKVRDITRMLKGDPRPGGPQGSGREDGLCHCRAAVHEAGQGGRAARRERA